VGGESGREFRGDSEPRPRPVVLEGLPKVGLEAVSHGVNS
jgi:hypothetical protein